MVNYIFIFIILISLLYAIFLGRVDIVISSLLEAPNNALNIFFTISTTLIFWSGILEVCLRSGLLRKITSYFKNIFHLVFRELDKNSLAYEYITLNIVANFLGLGSAATPFGLKAMEELNSLSVDGNKATSSMITFVLINSVGFSIIPTSIIALRESYGSINASSVIIYIVITSFLTLLFTLLLNEVFKRVYK